MTDQLPLQCKEEARRTCVHAAEIQDMTSILHLQHVMFLLAVLLCNCTSTYTVILRKSSQKLHKRQVQSEQTVLPAFVGCQVACNEPMDSQYGRLFESTNISTVVVVVVQAGAKDIDSATRLAWKYMMDSGDLLKGLEARQAFLDFMELMSASHPIPR